MGLPNQYVQHMGTLLCLLDQPIHRSNFGCMDFSCSISVSSRAETSKAKTELNKIILLVAFSPRMALKCVHKILKVEGVVLFIILSKF